MFQKTENRIFNEYFYAQNLKIYQIKNKQIMNRIKSYHEI